MKRFIRLFCTMLIIALTGMVSITASADNLSTSIKGLTLADTHDKHTDVNQSLTKQPNIRTLSKVNSKAQQITRVEKNQYLASSLQESNVLARLYIDKNTLSHSKRYSFYQLANFQYRLTHNR